MNIPLDLTRQGRCHRGAEMVKAFAAEGERLSNSIRPGAWHTRPYVFRSLTVCLRLLAARFFLLQAGRSLSEFGRPAL